MINLKPMVGRWLIPSMLLAGATISCKPESKGTTPIPKEPEDTTAWTFKPIIKDNPIDHIEWGTPVKVSHQVESAAYPRMLQLGGDTILLAYHGGDMNNEWDNIYQRISYDGGLNWEQPQILMEDNDPDYWGFANPEYLELTSGKILMAFTGRGRPDDNEHDNIQVMESDDRGITWSAPRIVATGRSWEPAMIQHPDGEVYLFYSSEARWWGTGQEIEQEILMVQSATDGYSWSLPRSVAYTQGNRDGMPVPLVLRGGKGIAFTIESINNADSPWMLRSSLTNRFQNKSKVQRYLAAPKHLVNFGGGPYLTQLPTGETILSLHDTGGRPLGADWQKNTMYVLVGDTLAKNFGNVSYPFPNLPTNEGAFFNSVYAKDANTIIALASRDFPDNHSEVYWVTGTVIRK